MLLEKSSINKILVISLSNIGDVVLTFPVIDVLKNDFPKAKVSLVVGPKAISLVNNNPNFEKVYVFDKQEKMTSILRWINQLRIEHFDLVVDLRNTAIPLMVFPKFRTPLRMKKEDHWHMRTKHCERLKSVYPYAKASQRKFTLYIDDQDKRILKELIGEEIVNGRKYVVFAVGAANKSKVWTKEGFAKVADYIVEKYDIPIVFIGHQDDNRVTEEVLELMHHKALNLCGKTTLTVLAAVFDESIMAVTNDSR